MPRNAIEITDQPQTPITMRPEVSPRVTPGCCLAYWLFRWVAGRDGACCGSDRRPQDRDD
jgi:hypothetical protein